MTETHTSRKVRFDHTSTRSRLTPSVRLEWKRSNDREVKGASACDGPIAESIYVIAKKGGCYAAAPHHAVHFFAFPIFGCQFWIQHDRPGNDQDWRPAAAYRPAFSGGNQAAARL